MFRSRFSWKLYATCAAAVLLTAGAVSVLTLGQLERVLLGEKEESLRHQCVRLGPLAAQVFAGEHDDPQRLVGELAGDTGTRVTLIALDGDVVADTHEDPAVMEDHSDRPEVVEALSAGHGVDQRVSRTLDERFSYVAHAPRGADGQLAGVVRLALPVAAIDSQLAAMRRTLLLGTVVGVVAALGLGFWLTRRLAQPVEELTRAANDLREGDYDTRVAVNRRDEFGVLGDALNRLGVEVTERIQELSGEEARLRAMLAGMVEGVVAVDEQDQVAFSNAAARRLFGVAELDGRRLWEAVRIAELDGLLAEARASDEASRRELVFGDNVGREVVLRAQAHRFRSEERIGVVVVLHDITEVRRLERIRRDFVANVSHELKTPLTSIRGYVETLLDGALEDPGHNTRFLEKIDTNVKRLNHLVLDLLSLARIEEQEDGLQLVRVDLTTLIEQAMRTHGEVAAGKDIGVEVVVEPDLGPVLADRESLVQVLDNLIDNAIKYTAAGGHVTVRVAADGEHVTLEVVDTGVGIPPEDLDRIFERFYRVDKARSREVGGTGLGLSIVKHLVVAMQGDVSVESEYQRGTTFRVTLKRAT